MVFSFLNLILEINTQLRIIFIIKAVLKILALLYYNIVFSKSL